MNFLLKSIAKDSIENGNYIVPIIIVIVCIIGILYLAFKVIPKHWKKSKGQTEFKKSKNNDK